MEQTPAVLQPRRPVAAGLLAGGIVGLAAVAWAAQDAVTSDRPLLLGLAVVGLALVLVVLPLGLARSVLRARLRVTDDAVERYRGDRRVARLRFADVEDLRVGWQVNPGVMSRRAAVTMLGPTEDGARGVAANGLLIADLEPLLDRVAAEVARRPDVLTSDRSVYDDVMRARPLDR